MLIKESLSVNNREYSIESGLWAKQAGGTAILRWGDIVIMANATAAKEAREGVDFFPLTIEYREKFYSVGSIPGGFIKREARPSDKEILISRVTDRPIRPLFPKEYVNELQIFITLLSCNKIDSGDVHAITAASAALMASEVPFQGPVAGVRVCRVDGQFEVFTDLERQGQADINVALAGTYDAVTMIEGHAKEVGEEDMLAAVDFGHAKIKELCEMQNKFAEKVGKEKIVVPPKEVNEELKKKVYNIAFDSLKAANDYVDKKARSEKISAAKDEAMKKIIVDLESIEDEEEREKQTGEVKSFLSDIEVEIVRDQIFNDHVRADGRKLDEIRDISVEVGVLPSTHGSAVFTRGETQALGVATLGTENDAQSVDDVNGQSSKRFYLHYNFLPFCVGEVRRYGGVGRREVGHGRLAESALMNMVPDAKKFPYVIRMVSEILESNGSSSMASVCVGSLAMMDAGVPIERAVAGIAMGLITKGDQYAVLSDIAGLEDHFGDMDFKVAGTEKGITAFQLDLKIQGLKPEIMQKALAQAKDGRMHILSKMGEALNSAREDISPNAPRITTLKIDKEKIGELIGPGGKNIKSIIERTGVDISVGEEGDVSIASNDAAAAAAAVELIESQFAEVEVNKVYKGIVKKITDFGAFIEVFPGKDGLCHISKLSHKRVVRVEDAVSEGDEVEVKILAVDRQGRISLSMKDVEPVEVS